MIGQKVKIGTGNAQLMPTIRRGRAVNPEPMEDGKEYARLPICPDCDGRGWFLINPFATGGTNGAGGIGNLTPCLTCLDSHAFWEEFRVLPPEIQQANRERAINGG